MRQFDVVANINPDTSDQVPYLLLLQANLFDDLATRVVAPLIPVDRYGPRLDWLNPTIFIGKTEFVISMAELAGVPVSIIGDKIASAESKRNEVISALAFLFTGS
jgi:toxin CcdB